MSHLTCRCGNVIRDNTDNLPYAGIVIRDQEDSSLHENIIRLVTGFVEAISEGRRKEWMDGFLRPGYDPDFWDNSEVVGAIISSSFVKRFLRVYQCEDCGRLHLQISGTEHFRSFFPDDEWRDALKVQSPMPNRVAGVIADPGPHTT